MPQIILASQSPYRRQQMASFGLRFKAERPLVDENQLKREGPEDLVELTRFLSHQKALSLRAKYPDDIILGSDQLVEWQGKRIDKPGNEESAWRQLKEMSDSEHRLITSLAMIHKNQDLLFTNITKIRFKKLNDSIIHRYLQLDQPFDCAGSYKIEKAGLSLIESLQTDDPSAIQGLPMMSLMRGLDKLNIPVTDFWENK